MRVRRSCRRTEPAYGDPILSGDKGAVYADRPRLSVALNIEGAVRTLHDRDVVLLIGEQQAIALRVDREIVGNASGQPTARIQAEGGEAVVSPPKPIVAVID